MTENNKDAKEDGVEEIIDQVSETSETEAVSSVMPSALPEAPDKKGAVEKALQAKIDAGENLSVKSVYARIFNEIAEKENISYAYVAKIAKSYLKKKSEKPAEIKNADGNKIKIEPVSPLSRPERKVKTNNLENVLSDFRPQGDSESAKLELEFETECLK